MAIDAYLKIGDIKGESTDDKHKQWIAVSGVNWGITISGGAGGCTSGGWDCAANKVA